MKTDGGVEEYLHVFLTSAAEEGEWSPVEGRKDTPM
jgi:hypothetical protein